MKKHVNVDFFTVVYEDLDGNRRKDFPFDLTPLLKETLNVDIKDTTRHISDAKARIQKIQLYKQKNIWELQLLKLREESPGGIADDDGGFEIIELEDGKYVGEFNSALYFYLNETPYILFHRNIHALSPTTLEEYLNQLITKQNIKVKLRPIFFRDRLKEMTDRRIYRKINFGIDVRDIEGKFKLDAINSIIGLSKDLRVNNLEITISIGKSRINSLNPGLSSTIIHDLYAEKGINKLKVGSKQSRDTAVELIDLLEDRIRETFSIEVDRRQVIKHDTVFRNMAELYIKYKPKFGKGEIG